MYSRAVIYVVSMIWFCLSVNGALTLMVWLFYGPNTEIIFEPEQLLMIDDMT